MAIARPHGTYTKRQRQCAEEEEEVNIAEGEAAISPVEKTASEVSQDSSRPLIKGFWDGPSARTLGPLRRYDGAYMDRKGSSNVGRLLGPIRTPLTYSKLWTPEGNFAGSMPLLPFCQSQGQGNRHRRLC